MRSVIKPAAAVWLVLGALSLAHPTWAQTDPGAARNVGEAPTAPLAGEGARPNTQPAAEASGAREHDRSRGPSMAFSENTGECRETVPGGKMLAIAYAILIAVLGAYVSIVARKATALSRSMEQLEADIARRAGTRSGDEDAT